MRDVPSKFKIYRKYVDVIIDNFDGYLIKGKRDAHIIISFCDDDSEFRFLLSDSDGVGIMQEDIQQWFKEKCSNFFKDGLFRNSSLKMYGNPGGINHTMDKENQGMYVCSRLDNKYIS